MAFTLSNLLQSAYQRLGQMRFSMATGGATSSLSDTTLVDGATDDQYKNGTIVITRDAAGASAAPEGEIVRVTGFTASTGTFAATFTVAPASGDRYGYCNDLYPLQQMITLANDALTELGDLPLIDTTTLDTAASQTEYTASAVWKRGGPFRVDYQGRIGDANDNQWIETRDYEYVPAAAGSTGLIVFRRQPPASRDIRVWYMGVHGLVNAHSDAINEVLQPDLVVKALLVKALEWRVAEKRGTDDFVKEQYNKAVVEFEREKMESPVWRPKRRAKVFVIGDLDAGDHMPWVNPYGPG